MSHKRNLSLRPHNLWGMLQGETEPQNMPQTSGMGHKRNISLRPHNLWGMLQEEVEPQNLPKKFIKRITLFKIPKEEDIETTLRQYDILRDTAVKNGKPYILHNEAGKTLNASEQRSQGWTVCVQTVFSSIEDVTYYDSQCAAHATLKEVVTPLRQAAAVMLFESDIPPPALYEDVSS